MRHTGQEAGWVRRTPSDGKYIFIPGCVLQLGSSPDPKAKGLSGGSPAYRTSVILAITGQFYLCPSFSAEAERSFCSHGQSLWSLALL